MPSANVNALAARSLAASPGSPQPLPVTASGIASLEAFGAATLIVGQLVDPTGIATGELVGQPTLSLTGQSIFPAGITPAEAFGAVVVSQFAAQFLNAVAIDSDEAFGVATLSLPGATAIHPVGIPSAEAFG